jgi:hypothetical protein
MTKFHQNDVVIAEFIWDQGGTSGSLWNKSSHHMEYLVKHPTLGEFVYFKSLSPGWSMVIHFHSQFPDGGYPLLLREIGAKSHTSN